MADVAQAPTPRAVLAQWFPAQVVVPDGEGGNAELGARLRVYATDEGLYVYRKPDELVWWSPISPGQAKPETGYRARNGVSLNTREGMITITASGGCGCGNPLKRWQPPFSTRTQAWPT